MTTIIILFGALIFLAGIIILIKPSLVFDLVGKNADKPLTQILAVVIRIILGLLFINQASFSQFPLAIEIIGWISIFAALFFAVIGPRNFRKIMSWAITIAEKYGRIGGFFAVCFGSFIIYSFI